MFTIAAASISRGPRRLVLTCAIAEEGDGGAEAGPSELEVSSADWHQLSVAAAGAARGPYRHRAPARRRPTCTGCRRGVSRLPAT